MCRCQYCRLQKCLVMGMRSDSPRVAAASEARRASNASSNTSAAGNNKRMSLDTADLLKMGSVGGNVLTAKTELYDSPTLLPPRRVIIPDSMMQQTNTTVAPGERRMDTDELGSAASSETSSEPSHQQQSLLSNAMDALMSRLTAGPAVDDDCEEDEIAALLADQPLLGGSQLRFELTVPPPSPTPSIHVVCETASRLLFKTLHWIRSIPAFNLLKMSTQVEIVRRSWAPIFALGLAQISDRVSMSSLLSLVVSHQQTRVAGDSTLNVKEVAETVCKIHQFVRTTGKLELDDAEFSFLKAILLFGEESGGGGGLTRLQDAALTQLESHLSAEGRDKGRFPRLLLLLSPLSSLDPPTLEHLFFSGIIGNIKIHAVIPYILQMDQSEVDISPVEQQPPSLVPSPPPSPPNKAELPSRTSLTLPPSTETGLVHPFGPALTVFPPHSVPSLPPLSTPSLLSVPLSSSTFIPSSSNHKLQTTHKND